MKTNAEKPVLVTAGASTNCPKCPLPRRGCCDLVVAKMLYARGQDEVQPLRDYTKQLQEAADHVVICWQLERDATTFEAAMASFVSDLRDVLEERDVGAQLYSTRPGKPVEERRVPVQGETRVLPAVVRKTTLPPGTITWTEHLQAWATYADWFGRDQSAEEVAKRGGFSYLEVCAFLGRPPETWRPR